MKHPAVPAHPRAPPATGHQDRQDVPNSTCFTEFPAALLPPRTHRLGRPAVPAGEERPERSQIDSCSTEHGCEAPFPKGHISHIVSGFHTFLSKCTTAVCVSKTGFKREKTAGKSDSPYASGFFSCPTHTHTPTPPSPGTLTGAGVGLGAWRTHGVAGSFSTCSTPR